MQTKTGRLTRSTGTDVRAQADPQDFETTMRRPAKPPVDAFWAPNSDYANCVRIQDWSEPTNRYVNVSYRLYILGIDETNATDPVLSPLGLKGSFSGATLFAEVPCSGRGGFIDINIIQNPTARYILYGGTFPLANAWVFITGVNRFGDESEPMSPVRIKV